MHIAALEGCLPDRRLTAVVEKLELPLPPVHMAMLISTYRLSSTKPTRSPPALIHRIRIDLKEVKGINTRQLPFNLTWTKDHLYVTGSWKLLQVWRIPLFSDRETEENIKEDEEASSSCDDSQLVMAPEKMVFMPKTCGRRLVRFFPSVDGETPVSPRIVVGHEASVFRGQLSQFRKCPNSESGSTLLFDSPVVCYLNEEKNLGNWVDSKSRTKIMENLGIGSLDVPIEGVEKFNPEDDCECESQMFMPGVILKRLLVTLPQWSRITIDTNGNIDTDRKCYYGRLLEDQAFIANACIYITRSILDQYTTSVLHQDTNHLFPLKREHVGYIVMFND
jgi:hypothetical protein